MTQNTSSNNILRSILDKEKLSGTNFLDWHLNLRIVLKHDKKKYVLETPVPEEPPSSAPKAERDAYCHTPKFALYLLKIFHASILKDSSRVDQTNSLLDNQPKLGFGISQIKMDFQHLQRPSCLLICFKESPCQVSSLTSQVSSDNCSDG